MARKLFQLFLSLVFLFWVTPIWATDYTQDANCQGAWLFTEGSGTTVDDASANSNTGNFKGDGEPAWYNASLPKTYTTWATDFDGTNDIISFPDNASMRPSLPITVVGWLSLDVNNVYQGIFCNNGNWVSKYSGIDVDVANTGKLRANFGDGGVPGPDNRQTGVGNSVLSSNGTWYHCAFVIEGAADMIIYLGGVDEGALSYSGTGGAMAYVASLVGQLGFIINNTLNGRLTEVGLFSRTLTSTEVNDIMDNGLVGGAPSAFFPLLINIF